MSVPPDSGGGGLAAVAMCASSSSVGGLVGAEPQDDPEVEPDCSLSSSSSSSDDPLPLPLDPVVDPGAKSESDPPWRCVHPAPRATTAEAISQAWWRGSARGLGS